MVDSNKWFLKRPGKSFGKVNANEESSNETRTFCNSYKINIRKRDISVFDSFSLIVGL